MNQANSAEMDFSTLAIGIGRSWDYLNFWDRSVSRYDIFREGTFESWKSCHFPIFDIEC